MGSKCRPDRRVENRLAHRYRRFVPASTSCASMWGMSTTRWSTIGIAISAWRASASPTRSTVRAAGAARHSRCLTVPARDRPGAVHEVSCPRADRELRRLHEQGWDELIRHDGVAARRSADRRSADYLAKNFPEQPRPKPVVVPGDVKVPSENGSCRRSVAAARSGARARTARSGGPACSPT